MPIKIQRIQNWKTAFVSATPSNTKARTSNWWRITLPEAAAWTNRWPRASIDASASMPPLMISGTVTPTACVTSKATKPTT